MFPFRNRHRKRTDGEPSATAASSEHLDFRENDAATVFILRHTFANCRRRLQLGL